MTVEQEVAGYESERKSYAVTLDARWDKHRIVTTLPAWGPKDARNLAEDMYPDFVAVKVELA